LLNFTAYYLNKVIHGYFGHWFYFPFCYWLMTGNVVLLSFLLLVNGTYTRYFEL